MGRWHVGASEYVLAAFAGSRSPPTNLSVRQLARGLHGDELVAAFEPDILQVDAAVCGDQPARLGLTGEIWDVVVDAGVRGYEREGVFGLYAPSRARTYRSNTA